MLYVKTAWIIRKTAGAYLEAIKKIDEEVFVFLKKNPNPSDIQVHAFAKEKEYNVHDLEKAFYHLATKYVQLKSEQDKEASDAKGFSVNIEKNTISNANFRKVLYTGKNMQLVLMSLRPNEDIGDEVHKVDQFFRIEKGTGEAIINGNKHSLSDGVSLIVPAGSKHNLMNTGKGEMKIYSIYSPPQHEDGVTHETKEKAMEDEEEHFDGKTTE